MMKTRKFWIGSTLAAFAVATIVTASSAWADCTGRERLRSRCKKLNNNNNKLIVKVGRSEPNSTVAVFLDDEEIGELSTNSRGKGKFVHTGLEDGQHIVRVCEKEKRVICTR